LDIHWHDGLFVLQHHLQGLQRSVRAGDALSRSLSNAYPWGVIKADLHSDALREGLVSFRTLQAVMPSGLLVDTPGAADLEPLRVADVMRTASDGMRVMLAVPSWTPTGKNVAPHGATAASSRWNVATTELRDENTGSEPEDIPVRRVNAQLVLEDAVPVGFEVLPLLRLVPEGTSTQFQVAIDGRYTAPAFHCSGSEAILALAGELAARLATAREEHLGFLGRGGYDTERLIGRQVEWMLRLQAISRSLPILEDTTCLSAMSPLDFYHFLRQLLGDLAPLRPMRDLYQVADYDHVDVLPVLSELSLRIRNLVFDAGQGSYMSVDFTPAGTQGSDAQMDVTLEDRHFVQATDFYLSVNADAGVDTTELVKLVTDPDRFKLLPGSMASGRVRGLPLSEDRFPPLALPSRPGRVYFRISREANATAWTRVREDHQMAAVWTTSSGLTFTLQLVMSTSGEDAINA
jgi:type VI secretion system ImpJ/VasE family protein